MENPRELIVPKQVSQMARDYQELYIENCQLNSALKIIRDQLKSAQDTITALREKIAAIETT